MRIVGCAVRRMHLLWRGSCRRFAGCFQLQVRAVTATAARAPAVRVLLRVQGEVPPELREPQREVPALDRAARA